jgi:hypothetical protein
MTHNLKLILLSFGVLFLASCSTPLLFTSLDVLRPAKVSFDLNSNNLLLVNNTITQPASYGHKTQFYNEKQSNVNVRCDSLALLCLSVLNEELENKDFFSTVQFLPNSLNKGSDFFNSARLSKENVQSLCKTNESNVILSLDKIKVNDELNEYFIPGNSSYTASLGAIVQTTWSIHYPNKDVVGVMVFNDTLYWESNEFDLRDVMSRLPDRANAFKDLAFELREVVMNRLPDRANALKDLALDAGRKSIDRFVPHWEKVTRYFFKSNNKLMKQGMDSLYVKNWTSAIDIWKNAYAKGSEKVKAQAANNISITYEIIGDMNSAVEFATLAYKSAVKQTIPDYKSINRIFNYVSELLRRKSEVETLKKQVGE